jgi:hypothetical protein
MKEIERINLKDKEKTYTTKYIESISLSNEIAMLFTNVFGIFTSMLNAFKAIITVFSHVTTNEKAKSVAIVFIPFAFMLKSSINIVNIIVIFTKMILKKIMK